MSLTVSPSKSSFVIAPIVVALLARNLSLMFSSISIISDSRKVPPKRTIHPRV